MIEITPAYLRTVLRYDPDTGRLYWKRRPLSSFANPSAGKRWNTRFAGKEAFTATTPKGYKFGTVNGQSGLLAHRVAWAIYYGYWPTGHLDHNDGNEANNRIVNLLDGTRQSNMRNQRKPVTNSSGQVGVRWADHAGKWQAYIGVGNGNKKHLGYFGSFQEAVAARVCAERSLNYNPNNGR